MFNDATIATWRLRMTWSKLISEARFLKITISINPLRPYQLFEQLWNTWLEIATWNFKVISEANALHSRSLSHSCDKKNHSFFNASVMLLNLARKYTKTFQRLWRLPTSRWATFDNIWLPTVPELFFVNMFMKNWQKNYINSERLKIQQANDWKYNKRTDSFAYSL